MKKVFYYFFMILFTMPVFAVEFERGEFKANIYGELYGDVFYTYSDSKEDGYSNSFGSQAFVGSSLLGVELSYGNVSGTFEVGLGDPIRSIFLTYNFGNDDHYILIGRDTTIAAYSFGMVSNDFQALNDLGSLADNRRLQLRYGVYGLELAVIIPSLGGGWNSEETDDAGYSLDVDENTKISPFQVLPRVELAYTISTDTLEFKVFGAYGAYMYTDDNNDADDKVFHSYNIGFGGQANFGNSFLQFTGWYGGNLDLMGALENYEPRKLSIKNNKIGLFLDDETNSDIIQSAGVAIGFGHTFNDRYTPSLGVGYTLNFGNGYEKIDDSLGAYLNCEFKINDWFAITPEIAYINYLQNRAGDSEGYDLIVGAMASLVF